YSGKFPQFIDWPFRGGNAHAIFNGPASTTGADAVKGFSPSISETLGLINGATHCTPMSTGTCFCVTGFVTVYVAQWPPTLSSSWRIVTDHWSATEGSCASDQASPTPAGPPPTMQSCFFMNPPERPRRCSKQPSSLDHLKRWVVSSC